jgi:hypothetical protein
MSYPNYTVVHSNSVRELVEKVNALIAEGYTPIGSHQVATIKEQNRYSGSQHMDTIYTTDYSQTLIKTN